MTYTNPARLVGSARPAVPPLFDDGKGLNPTSKFTQVPRAMRLLPLFPAFKARKAAFDAARSTADHAVLRAAASEGRRRIPLDASHALAADTTYARSSKARDSRGDPQLARTRAATHGAVLDGDDDTGAIREGGRGPGSVCSSRGRGGDLARLGVGVGVGHDIGASGEGAARDGSAGRSTPRHASGRPRPHRPDSPAAFRALGRPRTRRGGLRSLGSGGGGRGTRSSCAGYASDGHFMRDTRRSTQFSESWARVRAGGDAPLSVRCWMSSSISSDGTS
ncbi:hypothetical protein B0H15DRAFT_836994 [Mycena belliarum]|uniref:Uncharacterized protein n=1 Tax=Mycena belliarum TaxID=1033014 RepID=A0AAD6U670_9AGAR|nr:hypothetical protein B0H15DRAFT_836994 [Mycena belliae]